MEFYQRSPAQPRRLGILPGSFNPPTVAHRELAVAAREYVDEVLWVVPRRFPHKVYFGATLEQRLAMLAQSDLPQPCSIAASEGSLYLEIARECRLHYGPSTKLYALCGADAACRILTWDYGRPGVVEEMLSEIELLVAPRGSAFETPPLYAGRIKTLHVPDHFHMVSSTEVRERIAHGETWEHLVPAGIVETARKTYS